MAKRAFGAALREIRASRGWRQQDLVDRLDGHFARSTLANVEAGREAPSERLWHALCETLPDVVDDLEALYLDARSGRSVEDSGRRKTDSAKASGILIGGPYDIELIRYVYVFRESKAPEEVIEVRHVRAQRDGAAAFGLKITNTLSEAFRTEAEPLWGGTITAEKMLSGQGRTVYVRRFEFGRSLRGGERHDFALRTWIERDPEPSTEVIFEVTVPTTLVAIQLNFNGEVKPREVHRLGPLADELLRPDDTAIELTPPIGPGIYAEDFARPDLGCHYGIAWTW